MFDKKLKGQISTLEEKFNGEISLLRESQNNGINSILDKISSFNDKTRKLQNDIEDIRIEIGSRILEECSTITKINKETEDKVDKNISILSEETKKELKLLSGKLDIISSVINNSISSVKADALKGITDIKKYCDEALAHNFNITESLCKNNSIELVGVKKEQEIIGKHLSENDTRNKLYIDGQIGIIKEGIEKINSRLGNISQELSQRTGSISHDVYNLKDRIIKTENNIQRVSDKVDLLNTDIPGLREALKKNSSDIVNIVNDIKALHSGFDILKKELNFDINRIIEEKTIEYRQWINQEYYNLISGVILAVKSFIVKNPESDKELEELRKKLEQKALEEKWRREKELNGEKIINKGVQIIEKRHNLHQDILAREKRGENVEKLKEQLKAYDEILEMVKCEK
jgi:hypothetical protein